MSPRFRRYFLVATTALILVRTPIESAQAADTPTPATVTATAPATAAPSTPATQAAPAPAPISETTELRPGEFVWQPERAQQGTVEIVVSIPLQRAFVYRGGTLIGVTTVSTGRPGHETPVGTFTILQKRREHYSNLYNNAPMPFMQRLTWGGVALHAGQIPGRPASHGCVRLPLAFARHLFGATAMGGEVHVTDLAFTAAQAYAMVGGTRAYAGMGGPESAD